MQRKKNYVLICATYEDSNQILTNHYENTPIQILPPQIENFYKINSGSFHTSALNIDCGYLLEPPRRGGSNAYPQSVFEQK